MNKAESSGMTRDSNGVLKKSDSHSFKAPEESDMISSITMLVIGVIGMRMAKNYRPITMDVTIAAAGAAAFIWGEVSSTMGAKKKMQDMQVEITKSSDGSKDQAQIQRLQDLKKSYEEVKKTTGSKKTMQTTAAVAFAGAAAMAVYMSFQEEEMDKACEGAVKTAQSGLKECTDAGLKATPTAATNPASAKLVEEGLACTACSQTITNFEKKYKENAAASKKQQASAKSDKEEKPKIAELSMPQCQESMGIAAKGIAMGVNGACKPALSLKTMFHISSNDPKAGADKPATGTPAAVPAAPIQGAPASQLKQETDTVDSNGGQLLNLILFGGERAVAGHYELYQSKEKYSLLDNAVDFVFPRVQAGMMPLLGLGAGAAASYFLLDNTLGTMVDTMMYVPLNRAMLFGVLAGLCYMASQASQGQMDEIDENIKKIDGLLASMNALEKGIKANQISEQQIKLGSISGNRTQDMPISSNSSVKTECIIGSGSSNCKSLSDTMQAMPGFSDLPDSFKSIASQSAKIGDGLSGTNVVSGSTLAAASNLGGKQNAVNKLLKNAQKKLNNKLAAAGKPAVDFKKEQKNLLGKLNSQAAGALRSGGMSPAGFLSNVGSSSIGGGAGTGAGDADSEKGSGKKAVAAVPGTFSGSGSSPRGKDFDLDFKETEDSADAKLEDATPEAGKFDIGTNDINTDSGESLFELISNRYIKSGYPKLLEEIPAKN
jgi:hypothetical protein